MKKLLLTIVVCFATIGVNAQKTYALLMGVATWDKTVFPNIPKEHERPSLPVDAKEMKKVWKASGAKTSLLTSKYVTHDNVVKKLKQMVSMVNKNPGKDNLVVFFSGHGSPDGSMLFYDCMFSYSELIDILAKAKAKNVYVFIQACHSGTAQRAVASAKEVNPNMAIMVAARAEEYSYGEIVVDHSQFGQALLNGLQGLSDANGDRKITLSELFGYVYNNVVEKSKVYEESFPGEVKAYHPQLICKEYMKDRVVIKW